MELVLERWSKVCLSRKRRQLEQRHKGESGVFWNSKGAGGRELGPNE